MNTMLHRRHRRHSVIAVAGLTIGLTAMYAGASTSAGSPPDTPLTGVYELPGEAIDTLRTAAADLASPEDALATGRSELGCIDHAGHYFANPEKLADAVLDPADPEALVYADVDGTRQLVAVAWLSTAPGQVLGVPLHLDHDLDVWVLHAWIGLDNPAGMLADHNPDLGPCSADPTTSGPQPTAPTLASTEPDPTTPPAPDPTTTTPDATPAPTTTAPEAFPFDVSGTTHDFGLVFVGSSETHSVRITNTSAEFAQVKASVASAPAAPFSIKSHCPSVHLSPGTHCTVSVTFAPTSPGDFADVASLKVLLPAGRNSQSQTFEVSVSGTGVPRPTITTTTTTTLPDIEPKPDPDPEPDPGAGSGGLTIGLTAFSAGSSSTAGSPPDTPPTGVYELPGETVETLRANLAEFATPEAAVAAGRVDLGLCVDQMGDHFADPATFADGVLDAADPEALVYTDVDGTRQLVAVEWVSTAPGEVLGVPLHLDHDLDVWVLHAWIGLDNPAGMLADHNPDVGECAADPTAPLDSTTATTQDPTSTPEPTPPSEPTPTTTTPDTSPTPTAATVEAFPLDVAESTHDFGPVFVGSTAEHTVQVTNTSDNTVQEVLAGGSVSPGPFAEPRTFLVRSLAPGDSFAVVLSFAPSSPGAFAEIVSLTFTVDGQRRTFEISVSGTGVPRPTTTTTTTFPDIEPEPDPDPDPGAAIGGLRVGLTAFAAGASSSAGSPPDTAPTGVYELPGESFETLRAAAAGLASPEDALATGREELDCIDHTGHYFANPERLADGVLDPSDPEALVYTDVDGTRQLVAVEWVSTAPGEVLGVPLHLDHDLEVWVLHAWIGLDNSAGMLADHNPNVGEC